MVFGSPEDTENAPQFHGHTGLLCDLSHGALLRTLAGFNGAADGGPVARVDQSDEQNASGVISRQDSSGRKQEKVMPHLVS